MSTNFALVGDFHAKFGYSTPSLAEGLPARQAFLDEEIREVQEATREVLAATPATLKQAKAHLLKELIDVLYVTYGTLQILDVDADAAFAEVHRSNMSKTQSSATTKAVKGEGYTPAEMEQFIDAVRTATGKKVRVGVAGHVCHNGKVLAFERIGKLGTNTWTVLGGHLEYGEHWNDCAVREVHEEGGIATHSPQLFAITNDIFDGNHYVTLHVALKADTEAFTNAEPEKHQHLNWYDWNAIPEPRFPCIQSVYDQNLKPPYLKEFGI